MFYVKAEAGGATRRRPPPLAFFPSSFPFSSCGPNFECAFERRYKPQVRQLPSEYRLYVCMCECVFVCLSIVVVVVVVFPRIEDHSFSKTGSKRSKKKKKKQKEYFDVPVSLTHTFLQQGRPTLKPTKRERRNEVQNERHTHTHTKKKRSTKIVNKCQRMYKE